jgi:hypothetical protein
MTNPLFATTYQQDGLSFTVQVIWDEEDEAYMVVNLAHDLEWGFELGRSFADLEDAVACYHKALEKIHSEL